MNRLLHGVINTVCYFLILWFDSIMIEFVSLLLLSVSLLTTDY